MLITAGLFAVSCKPEVYTGPLDSLVGSWKGVRSEYFFNGENVADIDSCEMKAISFYKQDLCCIEGVKGAFPYTYDNETGHLQIDNSIWQVITLNGTEVVMQYLYTLYPPVETPDVTPASEIFQDGSEGDTTPDDSETAPDDSGDGTEETPDTPETPDNPDNPEEPDTPEEPEIPEEPEVKPDANGVILPAEYKGFTITADTNGYLYQNSEGKTVYCMFKGKKDKSGELEIYFWYDSHIDHFIPLTATAAKK